MAGADEVWCQLFSEPDAGIGPRVPRRTRAEFAGGVWRINGPAKVWSTWRAVRQARPPARPHRPARHQAPHHRGVRDRHGPAGDRGASAGPASTTGAAQLAEVVFTDAIVDPDDVVGEPSQGWSVTLKTLEKPAWAPRPAPRRSARRRTRQRAANGPLPAARRPPTTPRRRRCDRHAAARLSSFGDRPTARLRSTARRGSDDQPQGLGAVTEAEQVIFYVAQRAGRDEWRRLVGRAGRGRAVPLLARRVDLRRVGPDPAEHPRRALFSACRVMAEPTRSAAGRHQRSRVPPSPITFNRRDPVQEEVRRGRH